MQDFCYSWSRVSHSKDITGEKREWSNEEEEAPWCESFKSQSQSKSSEKLTQETSFSFSQPSSSQKKWRLAILSKKMKIIVNKRTNQKRLVFI